MALGSRRSRVRRLAQGLTLPSSLVVLALCDLLEDARLEVPGNGVSVHQAQAGGDGLPEANAVERAWRTGAKT